MDKLMQLLSEIMVLAYKASNCSEYHVFLDYSPHVNKLHIHLSTQANFENHIASEDFLLDKDNLVKLRLLRGELLNICDGEFDLESKQIVFWHESIKYLTVYKEDMNK